MDEFREMRDWMSGSKGEAANGDAVGELRVGEGSSGFEASRKVQEGAALSSVARSSEGSISRSPDPSLKSKVRSGVGARVRDALGFGRADVAPPDGGAGSGGSWPGRSTHSVPSRMLYGMIYLTAFMSLGHHADHVIRGNHVGWPLLEHPTPFTYSLGVYPLIVLGLFLYRSGRVGPGYWALLSGPGALFVAAIHFGPLAVEPPGDIIGLYGSPIVGWFAFAWLVAFVAVLVVTFLYEVNYWFQLRWTAA